MSGSPSSLLARLVAIARAHGGGVAPEKIALLRALERRRLTAAKDVLLLHECLCFLRAYPDDTAVLAQVERMLQGFARRSDLRRHRRALADSGIAGTAVHYRFFWFTARWLAKRCPDRIRIEWPEFENRDRLDKLLPLLMPYAESPGLDELGFSPREWIDRLKGAGETDAAFLVRRFASSFADPFLQETLYDDLDPPIVLEPGAGTPSRTLGRWPRCEVAFQTRPLDHGRPLLRDEIRRPLRSIRFVSPREGAAIIDLAREAMVTRARDLDNFMHADPRDARVMDAGDGLQFLCVGLVPERRLLLESVYGVLTVKNGMPIGYALASGLFGSSEVMYNIFETNRGGESARIYGRVLAMARALFGADTFSVDPYQLGHDNKEGLASGAFWFYRKLGFGPRDPDVRRLLREEERRMGKDPRHRSTRATLHELSAEYVFWSSGRPRDDVLGAISLGNVGLRISRRLAERFGADRERGIETCAREAARLLGMRGLGGLSRGERLAWRRWSPLVLTLPGVSRWSPMERRTLAAVVRAKGGRRESEYVWLFDRHRKLRRAIVALAADE